MSDTPVNSQESKEMDCCEVQKETRKTFLERLSGDLASTYTLCAYGYDAKLWSDMKVIGGRQVFKLHKVILASRSNFFKNLLTTEVDMSEFVEVDGSAEGLQVVLHYIYTGIASYDVDDETVAEVISLAQKYELDELAGLMIDVIKTRISIDNVLSVLQSAICSKANLVIDYCMQYINCIREDVLKAEDFVLLNMSTASYLLANIDYSPEMKRDAAWNWIKENPEIKPAKLLNIVDGDEEWDEEEVEQCQIVSLSTVKWSKSFGRYKSETFEQTVKPNEAIVYRLEEEREISYIFLKLDNESMSYKVDVSCDGTFSGIMTWNKVIDHSEYACHSYQHLYFDAQAVRFVKVTGCGRWPELKISEFQAEAMCLDAYVLFVDEWMLFAPSCSFGYSIETNIISPNVQQSTFHLNHPMALNNVVIHCTTLPSAVDVSLDSETWLGVREKSSLTEHVVVCGKFTAFFTLQVVLFVRVTSVEAVDKIVTKIIKQPVY